MISKPGFAKVTGFFSNQNQYPILTELH